MDRFQTGEWVDLREVWDGRTWELRRGILVRDDEDAIAVYTPPESEHWWPSVRIMDGCGCRRRSGRWPR
jgi:hypothetical protein